ncbi:hypothetical protein [Vibrio sp. D431a]|uniref:hypothetical protein n=1 Tax=Vibrio sp. D431a TaxID=2837388 RepID=UPI002552286F|nr:hypothetical protein [Vibrio sp. D431a]MDK9793331.1 hypothetical protein [Vibrio sp. D431a]
MKFAAVRASALFRDGSYNFQSNYIGTPKEVNSDFQDEMLKRGVLWARLYDWATGKLISSISPEVNQSTKTPSNYTAIYNDGRNSFQINYPNSGANNTQTFKDKFLNDMSIRNALWGNLVNEATGEKVLSFHRGDAQANSPK